MRVLQAGPTLLTREELENPEQVLDSFFQDFKLDDMLLYEKEVSEAALAQDDEDLGELSRRDLIFCAGELKRFWVAMYALRKLREEEGRVSV